jgi:hypothetical protein
LPVRILSFPKDQNRAVEPLLAPLFLSSDGRRIEDHTQFSKHEHHAAANCLEESATGRAVVDALTTP